MTLSKKNSRTIKIKEETYRWTISPRKDYLVFVAEHGTVKGRRIEVYVASDINSYWVNFPHVDGMNLKVITPRDASLFIAQAISQGWNPQEPGKPIVFDCVGDEIVRRQPTD